MRSRTRDALNVQGMTDDEVNVERFCRDFAERYNVSWAGLGNNAREGWRKQVAELLTYIDSTAFRALLPPADDLFEPTRGSDQS